MTLDGINSWNRVFLMLGMIFGGIVIGMKAVENTDVNIIFFGMLALAFITTNLVLQFKYGSKISKALETPNHV